MSNNKKSPASAKFYSEPAVEELYTGYLVKSPPLTALTKNTKSWKRRFFVLSKKTDEDSYQLTYHVNERRDKTLGVIDISKISLLFTSPETHQKWDWVKKQSKGSPSSVLFLKVEDILKHSREYFLIGENSADVDGWLNALIKAMKTQKSQNKQQQTDDTQEKRSRSMSVPVNYSEPNGEDQPDDRWSAIELTSPPQYDHYDYPRKLSEPPIPVTRQIPVIEEKDETDGKQDEPPEDRNEYMSMGSVKMVLEDDQQEDDTACNQKNDDHNHSKQSISFSGNCASTELDNSTSINGQESSVCNGAVNQDEDDENKCETHTHVEKEICESQNDPENSLILTQEGKPCVSECRQIQDSRGDQTLPPGTVQEIQKYIKRLSKDEVKLLIQRLPALTLNPAHHTEDTKQSLMRNLSPPSK